MALPSDDRSIWVEYKHYFFAVGGAFVGGLSVILGMTFLGEAGPAKPSQSAPVAAPVAIADKGEPAQAEQLSRILEAIANDERAKGHFETPGKALEYVLRDRLQEIRIPIGNRFRHNDEAQKQIPLLKREFRCSKTKLL